MNYLPVELWLMRIQISKKKLFQFFFDQNEMTTLKQPTKRRFQQNIIVSNRPNKRIDLKSSISEQNIGNFF